MANEETIKSDNLYALSVMKKFYKQMPIENVRSILLEYKDEVEIYNNCSEEYQYPISKCEKGYSLITTVPLPSDDKSLGKGALQMYFYFTNEHKLIESMHELYYPAHH